MASRFWQVFKKDSLGNIHKFLTCPFERKARISPGAHIFHHEFTRIEKYHQLISHCNCLATISSLIEIKWCWLLIGFQSQFRVVFFIFNLGLEGRMDRMSAMCGLLNQEWTTLFYSIPCTLVHDCLTNPFRSCSPNLMAKMPFGVMTSFVTPPPPCKVRCKAHVFSLHEV